jgi:hypothetical protein
VHANTGSTNKMRARISRLLPRDPEEGLTPFMLEHEGGFAAMARTLSRTRFLRDFDALGDSALV